MPSDPGLCYGEIIGIHFNSDKAPPGVDARHAGCAATAGKIQNGFAGVGVGADKSLLMARTMFPQTHNLKASSTEKAQSGP